LSTRVSGREIIRRKTPIPVRPADEESGPGWLEEFREGDYPEKFVEECGTSKEQLSATVRNMWELECLVRALDAMETLSSLAGLTREYVHLALCARGLYVHWLT
jgi:nuclear pore complex protein Nup107